MNLVVVEEVVNHFLGRTEINPTPVAQETEGGWVDVESGVLVEELDFPTSVLAVAKCDTVPVGRPPLPSGFADRC